MSTFKNDQHFKIFANNLHVTIMGYGSDDEDLTKKQKRQVEKLVKLEKRFKLTLQKDSRGEAAYRKFIDFIWSCGTDSTRNILQARPFFRERHGLFSKKIFRAIKKQLPKSLYKYNINYVFITFILNCTKWGKNSKVVKAAEEVAKARKEIIELNMPLAISRAMLFKRKTPDSHLTYMDIVQISMEGLINAVDKFVLPYSPVFRSVIIGRIVGDLINSYSDKMLHFYPSDRRKIYRANKANKLVLENDFDKLSEVVNSGTKLENPTNPGEIQNLMVASSHFSLESPAPNNEEGESCTLGDLYAAEESVRPDVLVEENDLKFNLASSIYRLSLIEQKMLKLKGLEC